MIPLTAMEAELSVEQQQIAVLGAIAALIAGMFLRDSPRYRAWTRGHVWGAAAVMGALVGSFVFLVWAGVFGVVSPTAAVAGASASALATHRRLTR